MTPPNSCATPTAISRHVDAHAGYAFADATCGTIRIKLLKIGALVRVSVRRIRFAMASACPAADDWGRAARRLADAAKARAAPT